MKIAFLDRDGIINKERGDYTWKKEDFVFTDGLFDFLKELINKNFRIVIITNQGGIDKGLYKKEDVEALHHWMKAELKEKGIDILDIFYCPHHSIIQRCICRKPDSELLEKAIAIYDVDVKNSFMIGDRERDVEAGKKVGLRSFLIESNPDWSSVNKDRFYHA